MKPLKDYHKEAFITLFEDGHIVRLWPGYYSVRDKKGNPVRRLREKGFDQVKPYCRTERRSGSLFFVLDKRKAIASAKDLEGRRSWVRSAYIEHRLKNRPAGSTGGRTAKINPLQPPSSERDTYPGIPGDLQEISGQNGQLVRSENIADHSHDAE